MPSKHLTTAMPRRDWRRLLVLFSAVAVLGGSVEAAEGGEPHGGRLQFVRALIEESSAAKRVAASTSAEAKAKREQARELHRDAEAAHAKGDHARAEQLLGEAAKTMFEAVRLAEGNGDATARKEKDFEARMASIDALEAAYERVCEEKKCPDAERAEVRRHVHARVDEAKRRRSKGEIDAARRSLDEAYVAIKVAIEHRRGGDTLVRSLVFANKEEEYRYELDRNDTHRMLITVLVGDRTRAGAVETVRRLVEEAATLRARAESEAAASRYEDAVRSLEASTRELQKALRGAGIYIPG